MKKHHVLFKWLPLFLFFFFTKMFFMILNGIWEVWGCLGAWHGPYDAIPSNFGLVWSYMAWGRSIFMFFGNIGNSLHHQIVRGNRIVWSMPCPWTPPDLLNSI